MLGDSTSEPLYLVSNLFCLGTSTNSFRGWRGVHLSCMVHPRGAIGDMRAQVVLRMKQSKMKFESNYVVWLSSWKLVGRKQVSFDERW